MSNNFKTLCIFSPAFPKNESETGWLPWLQVFVKALNRDFSELTIIIFAFQYPYSTATYKWHNNTVIPFNGMHKKKFVRLLIWVKILMNFYSIRRKNNIVGIFSLWCGECAFLGKYCGKLFHVKHYCWILGGDARKTNTYIKKIRPNANELIAASDFLQLEFYKNHHIKPAYIIPHGIDKSLFNGQSIIRDIDIIGVGNLCVLKRYDLFVEMVAELKKYFPSIKTMICGDGEERERIEKMISDLSIGGNIEMAGMLQHASALQKMQRAKILLHTSSYEGFGTVCIEALYAGAHVISFCKPLIKDIDHWHIVNNKEEMTKKVLEILQDLQTEYKSILVSAIDDTVKAVMKIFNS